MKLSDYTITKEYKNDLVLYNLISRGVLKLSPEYKEQYFNFIKNNNIGCIIDSDLKENLVKGGFLIENISEIEFMKYISYKSRNNKTTLGLTIAPTLSCNFYCPYCYEDGVRYNTMNDDVIAGLMEYIKLHIEEYNLKAIKITWYGGEPLLAIDKIEKIKYLVDELIIDKDITISYDMVSNGYLLNETMIDRLINLNIRSIQITLDGPKDIHDKRRFRINKGETYDRILENILLINNRIHTIIRINVDKENENRINEIFAEKILENIKENLTIYIARVDDINDESLGNRCMVASEFGEKVAEFNRIALDKGFNSVPIPPIGIGLCGAVTDLSYVIEPTGNIHKCWNTIGRDEEKIGTVFNKNKTIQDLKNEIKWSNYYPLDEECTKCKVLPLCFGGCAYHRLKSRKLCTTFKDNLEEILDLCYEKHMKQNL